MLTLHESDKDETLETLKAIQATLEKIEHTQMSNFVQLSRIYDVLTVQGLGGSPPEILEVIEGHVEGLIHTATPNLASFGNGFDEEVDR